MSARPIIAKAVTTRSGARKFRGYSAGRQPRGQVYPCAMDLPKRPNYNTSVLRPKSRHEFAEREAPQPDFVLTVCVNTANETCPAWPHLMLYQRIGIFTRLPLASLDKLSLQRRLDDIGRNRELNSEADR